MKTYVKSLLRQAGLGAGAAALLSCSDQAPASGARVNYVIDAPLCSSRIPVQFLIDSALVGTDTFVVALTPEHRASRDFTTTAGPHTVSARVPNGYVWPDQTVTLAAGAVFTDSLPFYCS